jgi:hypothetical protein
MTTEVGEDGILVGASCTGRESDLTSDALVTCISHECPHLWEQRMSN